MVGRAHADLHLDTRSIDDHAEPALELDDVSTTDGHRGISLSVHPGEILGLYGLVGAGRSELARAVLGLASITHGTVRIHGETASIRGVSHALQRYRLGYVTDFVDLGIGDLRWYTFNVADAAVSVAIVLLVVLAVLPSHAERVEPSEPSDEVASA